jgi:hypothetical protein
MKFLNKIMQKWFCCHEWEERKLIQEYYEIMYYNDRLSWLADKYSMILNSDTDLYKLLNCL